MNSSPSCNSSLAKTAEQLKITRHALRYRMLRLNLSAEAEDEADKASPAGKEASS